jgi:hypothetical protein
MEKKLKGILIDPVAKTLTEVIHNGNFRQIYKFIECDTFTVVQIDEINCIYVDDEGLLNNPRYFFNYKGYDQPLAGRGLVLGVDREGPTIGTNLTIEELTPLISFSEHSVQGWEHFEGETERYGIRMPVIGARPIFGPPEDDVI